MSESKKSAFQDTEGRPLSAAQILAEGLKRPSAISVIAAHLRESSASGEAGGPLGNFEKERHISVPTMPHLDAMRSLTPAGDSDHPESAGVLLRRLAKSIKEWRISLPTNLQPGVVVLLNGGVQIDVQILAQESFHGIRIEGQFQGVRCVVLAHQATVQILCIPQAVQLPQQPRRSIGFVIEGEASEA